MLHANVDGSTTESRFAYGGAELDGYVDEYDDGANDSMTGRRFSWRNLPSEPSSVRWPRIR